MRRERITITIRSDVINKIDTIIDGETIRNRSNAIETIVLKHFKHHILNKAVILAGGPGVMLDGRSIAKVLLPLGQATLLEKNLATLKHFGLSEVIISTSRWTKDVKKIIGQGEKIGISIKYYEEEESGTAGMLVHVKKRFRETFLMMNGDILLEGIDIEDMYNYHKRHGHLATLGVAIVDDPTGLGSITMKGPKITDFSEKPTDKKKMSHLVSGGVYFLEPGVCALAQKANISMEHDIFPTLAGQGELYGYQFDQSWVHLHDEQAHWNYLAYQSQ
ncbi:MAG: sugar phosphate nucleotidyltransferase [Planctomycetes bacterium]|jgi:NDP-sugar pyrophosphorylase family protein|nr:sugar phosphate nucleotidyltransferase [Planctomycetota bacterium]